MSANLVEVLFLKKKKKKINNTKALPQTSLLSRSEIQSKA